MTPHPSQRGYFAAALFEAMAIDPNIWVVTCDLGYGMLDKIRDTYPERFINVGAAEQVGMGIAVGLALQGKKPFIYSITPFLLCRPFETIRNYLNHEKIPVRLVGGGRDQDYAHDGFSHFAGDDGEIMRMFTGIHALWPKTKEEIPDLVEQMVARDVPWYINLTR